MITANSSPKRLQPRNKGDRPIDKALLPFEAGSNEFAAEALRALFENTQDAILVTDNEGNYVEANPAACRLFHASREQLIGGNVRNIAPPERAAGVGEHWSRFLVKGETEGEYVYRCINRGVRVLEYKARANFFPGLHLYVLQDVTDRKRAEEQLRESQSFLQSALDALSAHIAILDERGIIIAVNAAWRNFAQGNGYLDSRFGVGTDYLKVCEDAVGEDADTARCAAQGIRAVMTGKNVDFRLEYPCHSPAARRWFSLTVTRFQAEEPLRVVISHEEITERRIAEDRLRSREEHYRSLIEHALDIITIMEPEGTIRYESPSIRSVLGYEPEELIGRNAFELVHPEDLHRVTGAIAKRFQDEEFNELVELRFRHKDGSWRVLEALGNLLRDDAGQVQIVVNSRDITDRKLAEARILHETHRAEALVRVSARLNAQLDLEEVAKAVCEETALALECDAAVVLTYDREAKAFFPSAVCGLPSEYLQDISSIPRVLFDHYQNLYGQVIAIHDVQALDLPQSEIYKKYDIRTTVNVPMRRGEEIVGILSILSTGGVREFTAEEQTLLQAIADQCAQALVNARLYEDAARRYDYLKALRTVDMAITASLDLRVTFNVILDQIMARLNVDAAAILLLDPHLQTLDFSVGRGFRTKAIQQIVLRMGEGLAGRAVMEHQLMGVAHLRETLHGTERDAALKEEGFVSYFALPMIVKGQVKGVLEIFHRMPLILDPEWEEFLEILTEQAAIAVDNAALFDNLQRSNAQLTAAYDTTLEGWVKALDLRDKETEGHTQRVTELSVRLARDMGLPGESLLHIRRGALLHDIGKVGIPDSILLKPGALTPDEFEIMKRHTQYAYDMLSPIAYLGPALDIPYCHHERWDGTGYPRGLKGEIIPLSARIFAVVDTWDALRSDRPYRNGWPLDRVKEYILTKAGSHFDERVVAAFMEMIENNPSLQLLPTVEEEEEIFIT